ncbi:MAG: iron dependent repressor, metal binding and dimerization domain protein [Anaerolineales bacterium]|jgi:DtxR family Mn-dependent transcriptional regulator
MPDPALSLLIAVLVIGLVVWFFWPDRGPFWRWRRTRQVTERVLSEDALKHLHRCERYGYQPTVQSLAGALNVSGDRVVEILTKMETRDLVKIEGSVYRLTPTGREYALRVIRAHRLWERYLAETTGYEETEWHSQAEQQEHWLSAEDADALSFELGHPTHDPHGDPIPTSDGEMVAHGGEPLTSLPVDVPARIVHIEDEPEAVFAQLLAEDLHVGMEVRLVESSAQRVRFWAGGDEHLLAPIVAANISVRPIPEKRAPEEIPGERLSSLKPGQSGAVSAISPRSRGVEYRRLLDLGILPGTVIQAEMRSPSGDPTAYRVRGAVIALRSEQADLIYVEPTTEPSKEVSA